MTRSVSPSGPAKTKTPAATQTDGAVACGVLTIEVAAAAADGKAPEFIKITPRGRVTTRDGRTYAFDPERLVARFEADGVELPVDLDHAISSSPFTDRDGSAVGWITALEAREDGTYGKVDWLDAGRAVLEARSRRYLSALSMPALAAADPVTKTEPNMTSSALAGIAKALGLNEAADETACLSALSDMRAGMVDKAVHDETLANLQAVTDELAALKSENRGKEVDAVLDAALTAKKIVPAQRDAYVKLCATDEGLAEVKALLEATPEGLKPSGLDAKTPRGSDTVDPAALAAKATAYQDEQAKLGISMSYADAVQHVEQENAG